MRAYVRAGGRVRATVCFDGEAELGGRKLSLASEAKCTVGCCCCCCYACFFFVISFTPPVHA